MKGMIFAAGLGTRLAPLTDNCPKALIEVGGMTMLERVIRRMTDAGIRDIVVNVHHHADMIENFLAEREFGARIHISSERQRLLDTGGGVVHAAKLLTAPPSEPVMLYNADILTDFPIHEMMEAHACGGTEATLLVSPDRPSSRRLIFSPDGRMAGWTNTLTGQTVAPAPLPDGCVAMAFGGVHIINPSLIGVMRDYGHSQGEVFSLTPFYTATCHQHNYRAYIPSAPYKWVDIGRPDTLERARKLF
ncbi:MAG: nucleotidyltransferase family protein [Muribaculaceae bacterium]|nr:nucleotidyltransferase family protein [Muribaculaceae bacterium]